MTKFITFIDQTEQVAPEFYPVPASKNLPDWYKNLSTHINNNKSYNAALAVSAGSKTTATLKKCMPVYDMLTGGYLLPLPTDVSVENLLTEEGTSKWFQWPKNDMVDFHDHRQFTGYPAEWMYEGQPAPKFRNPWIIKTPPGYSTLFLSPQHRDLPFHTLSGIVDTDTYHSSVELPLYFKDPKWSGLLEAGTPMVQVIPFKRDAWEMELAPLVNENTNTLNKLRSTFFNGYKTFFWKKKSFK